MLIKPFCCRNIRNFKNYNVFPSNVAEFTIDCANSLLDCYVSVKNSKDYFLKMYFSSSCASIVKFIRSMSNHDIGSSLYIKKVKEFFHILETVVFFHFD